jgi:large subunit ribosomal protein L25
MSTTLAADKRTETGKGIMRKLRASGKLPAVLYGVKDETLSLTVDPEALTDIFNETRNRNTVVELDIEGEKVAALVREAQRHPLSRQLLHVDFQQVSSAKPVEVTVPVTTVGKPAGAVFGGRLRVIRRELRVSCPFDKIPETFVVDISAMNVGDMVKASQVETADDVNVLFDHDFNVLTVYGKKVTVD